ncbi:GlxA family transcriptional regulator [Mesorhizobium sp. CO1-1-8]|uniref:GlxA family transcriptional regulator n=1 Tax=Mesorhizobium sp. CO1-1-8 TaxID=2876631 RepID=UPI001CD138DB|nr:helix-turn-helix domain-containing protein [Mesorhizobium sp. CO1-1-8]MBZ9772393.1 DJ-1/PfpI family protein [Mesorhizobium sp. CO1-1-8]
MLANTDKSITDAPRHVVLIMYEQAKLLDITGPMQVFKDACEVDGRPAYSVTLASREGGQIRTDAGVALATETIEQAMASDVDTLLVMGGTPADSALATQSLRACLAPYLNIPRRIGSICTGAFILAELGVLDGLEATTHWGKCKKFEGLYPEVKLRADAIFVSSGRVWTSAGVTAGIDMALAMVEHDLGNAVALKLARDLVLFLKRPGGQSQFSVELQQQLRDARGRFEDLHGWIRLNLDGDLSVPALAVAAKMSPRNFARVYARETGESPARAVEQIRVEAARRLLETAPDSVKQIAYRIGFGDDERMRRAFLKAFGVSPHDYRSRFGRALH